MERTANQSLPVKQSNGLRRSMLMFLAFVYLFVGIAHNISCFDQTIASSVAIEHISDATDDGGTKTGVVVCDHCPTCVPAVLPAPSVAAVPSAVPAPPVVTIASVLLAGQSRLDTPPPKILT
jgi:hypothetical protein